MQRERQHRLAAHRRRHPCRELNKTRPRDRYAASLNVICVVGALVLPMIDRFHENRAREQKKPEKYHLT